MTDESSTSLADIKFNLDAVRQRIAAACASAGRAPGDVALVAVTKTQSLQTIATAMSAGLTTFGENYVQEAVGKMDALEAVPSWHFIGNLQTNKAQLVTGRCSLIQTIDRPRIAQAISRIATERRLVQDVLVQVKLGSESTKSGCELRDVVALVDFLATQPGIRLRGLMGIAPQTEPDGKISVPLQYFYKLKTLHDSLNSEYCDILSMGMSGDYEAAIAAGSTMVRVGSALFGARPARL